MATTATASSAGPRYAPEDPTLPKPWRGLVDGKTGYLYFWNPETNVTQYQRPVASPPPMKPPSPPAKSPSPLCTMSPSVQVQQSFHNDDGSVKDDDDENGRVSDIVTRTDQSHNVPNNSGSGATKQGSSAGGSSLSAEAYCRQHEITVTGDKVPAPLISFEATGFPSEILKEVRNAGFSAPTPIQAQSWPIALLGRDIVAVARTGSGKTLGYLIPGFIHLKSRGNDRQNGPTVLVLSPTRELATQIQNEAVKFGNSSTISCTCLYGGAQKGPQLRELDKGTDIVVATPGRLNDILEMRRVNLSQVSYLVLDEADRMLDMGFEPQIRKIVNEVPSRRQTLMYTATWPKEVRKIAADLLVNPVQVNIGNVDELVANKSITQHVEVLAHMEKHKRLEQILRSQDPASKSIIFCSTKKMCDMLARNLNNKFGAAAIHGDKSQEDRNYVLNQFRAGSCPVLVATDVAARGLDVKDIRLVINYDFPTGVEDYVHRIGRTGRAGATGVAYTFLGDQDAKYASDLIKILEGANQRVPPEVRELASRGGGMSKFRRWGPSSGGHGGESGYGGRDGGRGNWGISASSSGGRGYNNESQDRNGGGYNNSYGISTKSWSQEHGSSQSPEPNRGGFPVRSFHHAMMGRGQAPGPQSQRERSPSPHAGGGGSFHQRMMGRQ